MFSSTMRYDDLTNEIYIYLQGTRHSVSPLKGSSVFDVLGIDEKEYWRFSERG